MPGGFLADTPCVETYGADTYQLVRAGLAGGRSIPESVAGHPCAFAIITAPSSCSVHTRVVTPGGRVARCRPRRETNFCPSYLPRSAAQGPLRRRTV